MFLYVGLLDQKIATLGVGMPPLVPYCPSCIFVTPATREAETGGCWSKASLGKSAIPHLKNKLKQKGLEACVEW
jgi:hypothetical protein